MNLIVKRNYEELSEQAAELIKDAVNQNPALRMVLPTGNTPSGMYQRLVDAHQSGSVNFSRVQAIQLDEYVGIEPDDPRSFFRWLERVFINPVEIPPEHVLGFKSESPAPLTEISRFEQALQSLGGIDLSILGLGPNGHLAVNEPGTPFDAGVFVSDLTPESLESNGRYWGGAEHVPPQAYTLGLGTLSTAKHTLLLVSGEKKAGILDRVLNGPISEEVPASILRRFPHQVTVIADLAAADRL